ncbi:MAG: hypothetical protein ACI397_04640, partial [Paludibacteraceae bacterium]
YFALFNGDNRYAPLGDTTEVNDQGQVTFSQNKVLDVTNLANYNGGAVCASQGKGKDAWYKNGDKEDKPQWVGDNSWKITANFTGKLLICVDEDGEGQEWYPYVWLERPRYYLMGGVLSGDNTWGANNLSLPLVDKYDENGKYYANLYLKKDTYFALSRGGKRFAPESSMDITINDENGQPKTYAGSCSYGQDNSWKYVGESGLVRLVLDVENNTFTLEPWQMYLIGSAADGDQWSVANTSKPITNPYMNLETDNVEEGKYYIKVSMTKFETYFAFSDGKHRYANDSEEENKDINVGDAGQQGTYAKGDNSWKFSGATDSVRVCIDYTAAHKPYIWLEGYSVYPIGTACTWEWTIDNAVGMACVAGSMVIYSDTLTLKEGELKFLCQSSFGKHYGPKVNGTEINDVGDYEVALVTDGDNKWQNKLVGDYVVTLNTKTLTLTAVPSIPSSIENTTLQNDNIVYDIMGRALGTSLENLPQGIYVRNGKKFVVAQ